MNRNQVRKLNMFMVLWSFLNSLPQTIIALMPHFEDYFNDFKARVALLDEQNNLQTQNTLVYRSVKINKRELMVNDVQRLIFNVVAAVDYEENLILRESVAYSRSTLLKLPEQVCVMLCLQLHTIGEENLSILVPFGESSLTLEGLKGLILEYKESIPISKIKTDIRVMATKEILVEFKSVSEMVNKMTRAFRRLILTHNSDYRGFMISRKLVKSITLPLSIKGRLIDEAGVGVYLVKIVVEEVHRKQIKRSSKAGRFQYKNMEDGVYHLIFSRSGFVTKKIEVYITKGIRTEFTVVLEAAPLLLIAN